MAIGIRIWDASGNETLSLTNRVPRLIGVYFFSLGASGSLIDDGLLTGSPFFSATPFGSAIGFGANNEVVPSISFSGNVMTYSGFLCDQRVIVWVH